MATRVAAAAVVLLSLYALWECRSLLLLLGGQ
jgi:hypothetical protein